ncbi:centriole and centriolar satellite protein OFD1 isoform X2 [Microcaecilia unicolor]|uniref:Oral-facial-digital syndrome 1 protein isoform X2 n=1 Tax=Microcaecilia unicolor TaxID=1415580 RepID=A0A6P7Y352_9AMPH|nr:oral-facial-digital syndrome 1 protein isoform X2 [Microcaecilia unicolor]
MASHELKELSQDELRKRLYQTFKNRGVLDTLKTQLRNQLIRELKNPTLRGELRSQPLAVEGGSLLARASNSLVADHLHRSGYEYSLSVFYPECGLQQEKLFTVQDLLQLMKINPKSKLYKSLTSDIQQENKKGFLMQILMELTNHHMCKESHDVETQTISTQPYRESLVDKLRLIDREFAEIYPQRQRLESLEAKLTECRKQMEQQLQSEMATKLQYFKEVEIAKIRLEEKENSRKELVAMQQELEKRFQMKSEGLMSREKNAIERLQMHQEIEAKETYSQRQGLLKDIEMVRSREMELKQRIEAFELSQKLQEEKNKSIEEALRCRELAVRNIEDTYDQKLKNELLKYQIELKEEYVKRTRKVTEDEKKNKEEAIRLREEASVIDSKKEEIHKAVSRVEELELELNSANAQVSVLTRQNQLLTENLKETKDYPQLKAEKLELQTQIKFLRQQLEESHKELQQLRDKLSYPTAEQIALQAELRRAENGRKFDQDEFKTHKELLEKQLQNEADRCAKLTSQLLNCEDTTRRLNGQVEELKLQLQQTQLALENEVYRNPKPSLVDRSLLALSADSVVPHDVHVDGALLRPLSDYFEAGGGSSTRYRQPVGKVSSSPDSDIEFVAMTKMRIKELEKEAAYLEEAYRNYQKRLTHSAVRSSPQVRTRSPPSLSTALSRIPCTSHQKVTFREHIIPQQPKMMGRAFSEINIHGTDLIADSIPVQSYVSSPRRLSSTPLSQVDRMSRNRIVSEDKSGSYLCSPHHSPRCLSPIQKPEHLSSAVPAPSTLVPEVPIVNRHTTSTQQLPAISADFSDSSKPQKLLFEDLEESDSSLHNQEDIPEQAENDAPFPSGDINNWNQVTATVPVIATSQQVSVVEEEKQSEAEERREKDESEGQDSREAIDREQKEIVVVEEEKKELMEEPQGMDENQEETKMDKLELSVPSEKVPSADSSANPLEKYMQIILQSKDHELANKNSGKEEVEDVSLLKSLSNERDDSIAAISAEEPEEDFW